MSCVERGPLLHVKRVKTNRHRFPSDTDFRTSPSTGPPVNVLLVLIEMPTVEAPRGACGSQRDTKQVEHEETESPARTDS